MYFLGEQIYSLELAVLRYFSQHFKKVMFIKKKKSTIIIVSLCYRQNDIGTFVVFNGAVGLSEVRNY